MKNVFLTILISLATLNLFSQINALTDDNKQVILNLDGTWVYKESTNLEKKDIDCVSLLSVTTDKMTGKSSVGSRKSLSIPNDDSKKGIALYLLKSNTGTIIFSLIALGAGPCIEEDAKVNVLFTDGSKIELLNNGKFNCDGRHTQYFGGLWGKKNELEMFKTKEVETIRVWTNDGFVEEDFNREQSVTLLNTFKCITNLK